MIRLLLGLVGSAALLVALAAAALWWGQERLIFQPVPLPADHRFNLPTDVHEVGIDVPGARLHALHLRLPQPDGLVFYLHGNAGNLASWFVNLDFWRGLNVDLFMVDYRGFGKSSGRITSQAQLLADVQAAWQAVAPGYAGRPVVLAGRSLGAGLAAQLAAALPADQRPAQLLLVSPYRSLQALAAAPGPRPAVVLLHGAQDALIPADHSTALAALVPGAQVGIIAGAGHADLQDFPVYLDAVRQAVRSAVTPR